MNPLQAVFAALVGATGLAVLLLCYIVVRELWDDLRDWWEWRNL